MRKFTFPVVYSPKDLTNNEILIFKDQFQKFNIEIPIELREIVGILSNCRN